MEKPAIRNLYSALGVEKYYEEHGAEYRNPHFSCIEALLKQNEHRLDYKKALDFCCGSGEVSQCLEALGYSDTVACDPYTHEAYERNIGKKMSSVFFQTGDPGEIRGAFFFNYFEFCDAPLSPGTIIPARPSVAGA